MVLGFGAAGRAGKASLFGVVDLGFDDVDAGIGGTGKTRDDEEVTHGVAPTLPAPVLFVDEGGIAGKGFAFTAPPQLRCLLTADRDDCAVELFSLKTLRPPLPAALADDPGKIPLGPGSEG